MGVFNFYADEEGRWKQDTEGRCQSCGEWVEDRIKMYGQYICTNCAKTEQQYCEEEEE